MEQERKLSACEIYKMKTEQSLSDKEFKYLLKKNNIIVPKEKLYFLNTDDTNCWTLEERLNDARLEGLDKVTLTEAIPDDGTSEFVWCTYHGECVEKHECKKAQCSYYESKSGRGVCKHRGNLYLHGNEVTFDVPKID